MTNVNVDARPSAGDFDDLDLSRLLIDRAALTHHISGLAVGSAKDGQTSEELQNLVVEKGPTVVDETAKHNLLLDRTALMRVHNRINREMPDAWVDSMAKAGDEYLNELKLKFGSQA